MGDFEPALFDRRSAARLRRGIVKHTRDGRSHWFPPELNATDCNGELTRRDVAWEYGDRLVAGAFYSLRGRIAFDPVARTWRQIAESDESSLPMTVPINLFDKIKVVSCVCGMENLSRTSVLTGSVGVQNRSCKSVADAFLQEVSKCDSPIGTVARYKMSDSTNAWHAHFKGTDYLCTLNVNLPRGVYELGVLLRSMSAWHRYRNPRARFVPRIVQEEENNNSITVDSVISAVTNELSFKDRAVRSSSFLLLSKAQFRTHKYIVNYEEERQLYGRAGVDLLPASACSCARCSARAPRRRTFHKKVAKGAQVLRPVFRKKEIQVHDRCFNCSAVSGSKLMPVVCEMASKLLGDKETAKIDLALASCKALVERTSNGLLPAHVNNLCEILCWQRGTRKMAVQDQLRVYRQDLKPLLQKIRFTRQNFAQSGRFCQAAVRGHKLLCADDRELISHKHKNPKTMEIFGLRGVERKKKKSGLGVHMRRNRGPVWLATMDLARYPRRMRAHGMALPQAADL